MLAWILNLGFAASPPGLVTVPDVTGETQAQATTDITALGLTVSVSSAYSSTVAAGLVISQVPAGGSQVTAGSDVAIVVSLGDQPVAPDTHDGFPKRKPPEITQTQVIRESDLRKALAPRKAKPQAPIAPAPQADPSDEFDSVLLQVAAEEDALLLLTAQFMVDYLRRFN